jgi:hypothetical protein
LSALALLAISRPSRAAEKLDAAALARTIAPFVDGETVAVAHVDVSRVSPAPIVALLTRIVPDAADEFAQGGKEMAESVAVLRRERVTELFAVVSLGGRGIVPRISVVLLPEETERNLEAVAGGCAPRRAARVAGRAIGGRRRCGANRADTAGLLAARARRANAATAGGNRRRAKHRAHARRILGGLSN